MGYVGGESLEERNEKGRNRNREGETDREEEKE